MNFKKVFLIIILCGLAFSISSCDKIESDGSENGSGQRPVTPGYKEYSIDIDKGVKYQDSILYDKSVIQ